MIQNINVFIAKLLTKKIDLLVIDTKPGRGAIYNLCDKIADLVVISVIPGVTTEDGLLNSLKSATDRTVVLDIEGYDLPVKLQQTIANVYRTRQIPATFAAGTPEMGILIHAPLSEAVPFTGNLIIKTFGHLTEITCDMAGVEVVTW